MSIDYPHASPYRARVLATAASDQVTLAPDEHEAIDGSRRLKLQDPHSASARCPAMRVTVLRRAAEANHNDKGNMTRFALRSTGGEMPARRRTRGADCYKTYVNAITDEFRVATSHLRSSRPHLSCMATAFPSAFTCWAWGACIEIPWLVGSRFLGCMHLGPKTVR